MKPIISVVVCCYRGEETIQDCLVGLTIQNYPEGNFEVVLVDDGSLDNSAEVIKTFLSEHPETTKNFVYKRKKNKGLSVARNFGINNSSGEYIVFIDEDCIPCPNYLSVIVAHFNNDASVNCIGGEVDLLNDKDYFPRIIQASLFSSYMKGGTSIIGTNMAFRRSILLEVGLFQPEFTYRGDESALFAKSRGKIVRGRNKDMRVMHMQPPNRDAWLRTRYENGYFKAAIDHFMGVSSTAKSFCLIKALMFRLSPLVLLAGIPLLFLELEIFGVVMILFSAVIFLKKFVVNGYFSDVLGELKSNWGDAVTFKDKWYVFKLIVLGEYRSDYGYSKGYFDFKKVIWKN
tara:strand:- start:1039 stop:2073 length:1035 start_codon:yes stop_codon:yes gene_type:complete